MFVCTNYTPKDDMHGKLKDDLALHGVIKLINIDVIKLGKADNPWGGYRVGCTGTKKFSLQDFGIGSGMLDPK